jgi:tryptophan 7-halogenase
MDCQSPIKKILIVGGGTAGWMSAAYLNRFLHHSSTQITLVESPSIETIGVGEATIPTLVRFLRNLDFDELEFMQACHATYKLGIKFENWVRKDHAYWHPFGYCGGRIDNVDLFHHWVKAFGTESVAQDYSAYSLQATLADLGKAPCPVNGASDIIESGAYAYHLDAGAFAEFLRVRTVARGVHHVKADIDEVKVDDKGDIAWVRTRDEQKFEADLYLDCTGFNGLLVEQALDDAFIDWSDHLLCDKAVVLPLPPADKIRPLTRSTALRSGWCWEIPLTNRTGCGYVYSSNHTTPERAIRELRRFKGVDRADRTEPRHVSMRIGHRTEFWKANCVSIGLAGGFVEPLESTGLFFIQHGLELLMDHFPDGEFPKILSDTYNQRMARAYEEVRDFIMLHYALSTRKDTRFWRDCQVIELPDSLCELMALYEEIGTLQGGTVKVFPEASYFHILSGSGCLPRRAWPVAGVSDASKVLAIMQQIRGRNRDMASSMPAYSVWMQASTRMPS